MDKQNLASEKNDLKLAAAALEKHRAGQKASVREAAALDGSNAAERKHFAGNITPRSPSGITEFFRVGKSPS